MPTPFTRTTRAVEADGSARQSWRLLGVLLLLAGWSAWFFGVPVAVYETSQSARLEADRAIHPIESAAAGRVVTFHLELGLEVEVGTILVELDSEKERRQIAEARQHLAGLTPQQEALRRQISAEEDAVRLSRATTRATSNQALARKAEAEAAMRYAADESARFDKLGSGLSELDRLRARAEAEQRRSATLAIDLDVTRVKNDQRTKESTARAHIEELRRELATVESEFATTTAAIEVLEQDIERRIIRAPVAGRIGAVSQNLKLGAFVKEGDRLGAIVPAGNLRATADFLPQHAIGRIVEGQPGRLRLDGFPWTQFGSVRVRVLRLESEPRDGRIRVELAVLGAPSTIPMQHGLPGTLEIEVERSTPATLVLRACGRVVGAPSLDP